MWSEIEDPSARRVIEGKCAGGCGRGGERGDLSLLGSRGTQRREEVENARAEEEEEVEGEEEEEGRLDPPPQPSTPFEALRSANCCSRPLLIDSFVPSSVSDVKRSPAEVANEEKPKDQRSARLRLLLIARLPWLATLTIHLVLFSFDALHDVHPEHLGHI